MKKTTRGRKITHIAISNIVGFTCRMRMGAFKDENGKIIRDKEESIGYIEVEKPDYSSIDNKLSTRKIKEEKKKILDECILKARILIDRKATELFGSVDNAIILPRILKTSKLVFKQ